MNIPHARSLFNRTHPYGIFASLAVGATVLAALAFASVSRAQPVDGGAPEAARRFPESPFVVNVKSPPYRATGDGVTDDTAAIQAAINEHVGRHRLLYFPAGTYLVSKTITWPKRWGDKENWGKTYLCGEHPAHTVLRLKDATFTQAGDPQAIMWCGGFGSADWFHNYIENMTFDVGERNPGAIALQFYSNNTGAVRNCRFLAGDGSGAIGLDLAHRDMNGPLLVKHCEVRGFRRGVVTGRAVNSQTFEDLHLQGQRDLGFENQGQSISIRGLVSENEVPAVMTYGNLCLVDAKLRGLGQATNAPAIINYNGGRIFVRDVATEGYARAIGDVETPDSAAAFRIRGADKAGTEGPHVTEYSSLPPFVVLTTATQSLSLPVLDAPEVPWDAPERWANVDAYGADPTAETDSSAAIQQAVDSGATTIFFPGSYLLEKTVTIRGHARRLVGVGGQIDYFSKTRPDFRVETGIAPVVCFEHFANIHGGLLIDTKRTIVLRSVGDCPISTSEAAVDGQLFLEDVCTSNLLVSRQHVWARQLNIENEGTHLTNDGRDVWILGYKTERGGTLFDTRSAGRTEVLGGFSYTTTAGKLAPMIRNVDSSVFAFFAEICFNDDPFEVLIYEQRGTQHKKIPRDAGHTVPYSGWKP